MNRMRLTVTNPFMLNRWLRNRLVFSRAGCFAPYLIDECTAQGY